MAKGARNAFNKRIADIAIKSQAMKQIAIDSQFDPITGAYLTQDADRIAAIDAVIANEPMFESLDPELAQGVVTACQSAVREYEKTYGEIPRDEVFAAGYQSMSNMMMLEGANQDGTAAQMMFESIGKSLSSSDGIEIRAKMLSIVFPVLLKTTTLDAVTTMPSGANEVELFKVHRRAGSSFGDLAKGDLIDQSTVAQYSSMKQRFAFPDAQQPDGSSTTHVFDSETDLKNTSKAIPFHKGSVSVWIDHKRVCRDLDGSGNGMMSGIFDPDGAATVINCVVDYGKGKVTVTPTAAIPDNIKLHLEFEVDIETAPELIPTIDHDMESKVIRPYQRAIASDASIQAQLLMNREFGQDIKSMQMAQMRNLLAAEKSQQQLSDMKFVCTRETSFNCYVQPGEDWKLHREQLYQVLLGVSDEILSSTKVTGLTGLYCGTEAANLIKSLGTTNFQPVANYKQTNDIHFCGTLFGMWKVYQAPLVLEDNEIICYGRGASHSQAGYVVGDAIPATMYDHPIGANLRSRNTLYELTYGEVHPFGGEDYFYRVRLINHA